MLSFSGLESSLLLAHAFWSRLENAVPGELVVGVPARDVVIVTGSQSAPGLEKVRRAVDRVFFAGDDNLLTRCLLVRRGGSWEPFDRPTRAGSGAPRQANSQHLADQPPRQFQEHPSWPGERVPVAAMRPPVSMPPAGPSSLPGGPPSQVGPGRPMSPMRSAPPMSVTGAPLPPAPSGPSRVPTGMTAPRSGPPQQAGAATQGGRRRMPPQGSHPAQPMSSTPASAMPTSHAPAGQPLPPRQHLADRRPAAADVAPYSAMPYSAVPYSAVPYSAMPRPDLRAHPAPPPHSAIPYTTPYSAAPYSATPYSGTPYSGAPLGGVPRSRGVHAAQAPDYRAKQPYPDAPASAPVGASGYSRPSSHRAPEPPRQHGGESSYSSRDPYSSMARPAPVPPSAPMSAVPYSTVPYSMAPYAATPYSAQPYPATPYSAVPYPASYGDVPAARHATGLHRVVGAPAPAAAPSRSEEQQYPGRWGTAPTSPAPRSSAPTTGPRARFSR